LGAERIQPTGISAQHKWRLVSQMNEAIDMAKAMGAGTSGVGVWYLHLSQILQISISVACLVYLVAKIVFLIRNKGK
jgi:hypothetical protein